MAGRCGCSPGSIEACQCAFEDSDTINLTGSGNAGDPFSTEVIVDPISGNILEDSAAGLRVLVPSNVSDPPHATMYMTVLSAHTSGVSPGGAQTIPFDSVSEDNRSHFDAGNNALVIVEDGMYYLDLIIYWSPAVGTPNVGNRHSRIYVDGVDREVGFASCAGVFDTWSHAVGGGYMRRLVAGQVIQGLGIQSSGGNLRWHNGVNGTVLSILRVGD